MNYTIQLVFLLIIATTQTTSLYHHCNTDVYSSSSGMADLQQLTTLQYCLIDNCTIMRIDTGQQLDIIYTTQSHLVVNPTDGQTSMFITKNDPEMFCSTSSPSDHLNVGPIIALITVPLTALVSSYIVVVHMMFEEIRGTFGKLMMLGNIALVIQCLNIIPLLITRNYIKVHLMMPCYLFTFLMMEFGIASKAFATTFLAYLAYVVHHCYKSIEVTEEINKKLYKHAIMYVCGLSLLFGIFVVGYDFGTGAYKHTLLPNGHCNYFVQSEYNTVILFYATTYLNEIIQSIVLVTYFTYYHKLNKELQMVREMANIDTQQKSLFRGIAITMGATLGISHILLASTWYFDSEIILRIGGLLFLIQHCVIMLLYMYSKKVSQLCKERFCTTSKVSPLID